MKLIKETNKYIIIEFDEDELNNDEDIKYANKLTKKDIKYEFEYDNKYELMKIYKKLN